MRVLLTGAAVVALAATSARADFSYQETTQVTGGAMVSMLKVMGVFSKSARQVRDPIQSTVSVKGDRMVHRNAMDIQIIDLAAGTITNIDLQKKTYTVMTFEQMKEAMQQAEKKMEEKPAESKPQEGDQNVQANFKVSLKDTGKTKQLNGLDVKEVVLTLTLEGKDTKTGQSGSMVTIADEWIAPKVPGYDEVIAFHRRMAEKLNWTPNSNIFMGRPEMAQGMAELQKEGSKLNGIPVYTTIVMGPEGAQPVDRSEKPVTAEKSQGPSMKSAIGGALGGRFGLGRKKEPPQQQPTGEGDSAAQGVLIEMTSTASDFSSAAVDPSVFEIPAGFKQVQPATPKRGK